MTPDKRNAPGVPSRGAQLSAVAVDPTSNATTVADLGDLRPAALRAWAAACWHLALLGLPPLPPPHVVRALRRRGWWPR